MATFKFQRELDEIMYLLDIKPGDPFYSSYENEAKIALVDCRGDLSRVKTKLRIKK
ncbi:hypothetical protein QTG56_07205 [Rossellomorea sp. AcN35-11]|nr:hypothetical protein [Rossellomorea aquimaris]NMH70551.1 hypothetical protein [Bacillus sp. RO3]WJV30806.1 hypothetical protein QTG56_07205 [Rossellomorea sp. AcN35-11]